MADEDVWTDRLEAKAERAAGFATEIKGCWLEDKNPCDVEFCENESVRSYSVGPVIAEWFEKINVCEEHADDDIVLDIYERRTKDNASS